MRRERGGVRGFYQMIGSGRRDAVLRRLHVVACLVLGVVQMSCGGSDTAIRVHVAFDDAWELETLEVGTSRDESSRSVRAVHELYLLVPDEWAAEEIELHVSGRHSADGSDTRRATGSVRVTPELGAEVEVMVSLARVPCGAWCVEGSTSCRGDGVSVCEQRDGLCLEWNEPTGCDSGLSCSHGRCQEDCVDECAMGETRCAGPGAVAQCGQADADSCLDWLTEVACSNDEVCSAGTCSTSCVDECEEGQTQCLGDAVVTCGDLNQDDCLEWSPAVPCAAEESCGVAVSGQAQCSPRQDCQDECSEASCRDTSFVQCGNYDSDPCLEASPGVSCVPSDRCLEGACGPSGCETAARLCNEPPPPRCLNETTLQTYDSTGSCEADGTCTYAPTERPCANCNVMDGIPSCDACEGVSCTEPPGQCFAMVGSCSLGSCSYAPTDGASCDDGNACTENDRCRGGTCSGTAKSCTTAPTSMCVDDNTLRIYSTPGSCTGGTCDYGFVDMGCANCPSCDPCEGVLCNAPPGICFESSGTCSGGTCSYTERTGGCNDGDACTTGDMCADGICSGTPVTCETPPAPECADANTLRSYNAGGTCAGGTCSYPHSDTVCENGCAAGECVPNCSNGWIRTNVEPGPGWYSSMVTDAAGVVHLSFCDTRVGRLTYLRRDPTGTWSREDIGDGCGVGTLSEIALDPSGDVHVAYDVLIDSQIAVRVAYRSQPGMWAASTVRTAERLDGVDLYIDGGGTRHVSFNDSEVDEVRYARQSPSVGWDQELVHRQLESFLGSSQTALGVDSTGAVHLAYYDERNIDLGYALRDTDGAWSLSWGPEPASNDYGEEVSLVVDGADVVHIVYTHFGGAVSYVSRESGDWSTPESIGSGDDTFARPRVAVDDAGGIHVVYTDPSEVLQYARRDSAATWNRSAVDMIGALHQAALDVDSHGTVHLSYVSATDELIYARSCP